VVEVFNDENGAASTPMPYLLRGTYALCNMAVAVRNNDNNQQQQLFWCQSPRIPLPLLCHLAITFTYYASLLLSFDRAHNRLLSGYQGTPSLYE
jgi:hypothetical protein